MSQTVYTDLGPGQIVASETTRGRTQYKVAGDFGEVWLDEAKIAGQLQAGYESPGPGDVSGDHWDGWRDLEEPAYRDQDFHDKHNEYLKWLESDDPQAQWENQGTGVGDINLHGDDPSPHGGPVSSDYWRGEGGPSYEDMGYNNYAPLATEQGYDSTGHYGYREAWAPVDHENSVNLPYNPTPQYPAIPGDTESTIQPNHEIDADERLHPSDSITLEDRERSEAGGWPAPSPRNFAGGYFDGPDDGPGPEHDPYYDQHRHDFAHEGEQDERAAQGGGWPHSASFHEAEFDPDAPPHNLDPDPGPDLSMPQQNTGDPAVDGVKPGKQQDKPKGIIDKVISPLKLGPGWDGNVYASRPSDRAGDAWASGRDRGVAEHGQHDLNDYGEEDEGWNSGPLYDHFIQENGPRHGALDERYAELMVDADFHNNPVAQFRHDPDAFINRIGHVHDEGHNLRMAEYMDLVEANTNIREAAWADVRRKAMRLRAEGKVHTEDLAPDRIYASVEGDTGTYETMISKKGAFGGFGGGHAISNWHCSCEWGKWAFRRRYTYVGRLCSHGYACYLTMQSAHMTGQPRQQRLTPYPKRRKRADALQMEPQRLVPEMVVNDTEDEHLLVDPTKDERKTTGPDGIVHFTAAERDILAQRALDHHGAWHLAEDQHDDDWKVEDAADGGRALNKIRDWADRPQEDDLGHMDRRVDEIRDAVEDARDAGTDADQLVASRRYADDEHGPGWVDPTTFGESADGHGPGWVDPNSYSDGENYSPTPGDDPWMDSASGGADAPGGIGGYGDAGQTGIGGYPAGDSNTIGGYGDAADTTLGGGGQGEHPSSPTDTGNPSGGAGGNAGGGGGDYTVKPGDTLTDIIKNQGSGSSVDDVAHASGIGNPNLIHPGDTIKGLGTGGGSSHSNDGAAGVSDPSGGGPAGDSGYSSLMSGGGSSGGGSHGSGGSNPADPNTIGSGGGSNSSTTIGPGSGSNSGAAGASDSGSGGGSMGDSGYKQLMSARDYHDWHVAAYGVPPRRMAAPGADLDDDTDGAPPPADLASNAPGGSSSGGHGESPSATKKPAQDDSALAAGLSDTGNGSSNGGNGAKPGAGAATPQGGQQQPHATDGMGGMSGIGLPGGGLSGLTNAIGQGVGALTSLPGLMGGGGLSGIGSGISGLVNGLSGLTHLLGSNESSAEDYRQWHLAAYGTEPQRTAAYPEAGDHHPFNGSGWPGDLEIGSSEDAMKSHKYEDVTALNDTDYAGSPEALRTSGINRVGKGPQRPPVVPEVVRERRPRNQAKTAGEVFEFDDSDPYSKTAADFADPADVDQMAVRTAAAGGDIVAQFQASGGGAVTANASAGHSNDDIAAAASQFLQRTAGRNYSPAEQEMLMREGDRGGARNLDELRLEGTHYSMNSVGLL